VRACVRARVCVCVCVFCISVLPRVQMHICLCVCSLFPSVREGARGAGVRGSKKRFARGAKLIHKHTHIHTHKRGRNTLGFISFFDRPQHGDDDSDD